MKIADFLQRDFRNEDHRNAAAKNAFALLGQHRSEAEALCCFFAFVDIFQCPNP